MPGVFSPSIHRFAKSEGRSPAVSVVMTTWNEPRFLREAVAGVLAQTFIDFELIVVDDGSNCHESVTTLTTLDPRIRVARLDTNQGAASAGNYGISMARAPIIARMDYDDRAEPGWLAALMAAFEGDAELGLVGSWVTIITEHGDPIGIDRTPESDFAIRFTLLSHNPMYHSSTAYRRELFDLVGGIEPGENLTHDLRLWRAMLPHCRARNLPEPLVRYRYNPRGITGSSDPLTKRSRSEDIRLGLWQELGLDFLIGARDLADEVDNFLRNRPCARPELWSQITDVIQSAINATSAKAPDFLRPAEQVERDAFVDILYQRLARGPIRPPNAMQRLCNALRTRGVWRTAATIARRVRKTLPFADHAV